MQPISSSSLPQSALAITAVASLALCHATRADNILYGVPKVGYGPDGVTPFPMCVRACDQFLGGETPYPFIMAASGAAFRLAWNTTQWDGGNVDVMLTYDEPEKAFKMGFASIGRDYKILNRNEAVTRDDFFAFVKTQIDLGNPCVALGVIGPPEACIVAGYLDDGQALLGWNFFQNHEPVETDHNGYFITRKWWDNKETRAVMSFAEKHGNLPTFANIVSNAVEVLSPRTHGDYAKGLMAYDAWHKSMQDDAEFPADITPAALGDRMMCQDDAMSSLQDGRYNAAVFFKDAAKRHPQHAEACEAIAGHFEEVRGAMMKMAPLVGGWFGGGNRPKLLASPEGRVKLCALINEAKAADEKALEKMRRLLESINYL